MNRKTLLLLGLAGVLALGATVTELSAACGAPQLFQLAFSASGNPDRFLVYPTGLPVGKEPVRSLAAGVIKGRWWQAGARSANNEGADCPESAYLIAADGSLGGNAETVYGAMGGDWCGGACGCGGVGCPSGAAIFLFQTLSTDGSESYYAVGKTNQGLSGLGEFDWTPGPDWAVTQVTPPRVTTSSRNGSTVTVNLVFDAPTGARGETGPFSAESILSGYQLVSFEGTGDPGRAAGLWANQGAVIPVSSTGATVAGLAVTCSGTTNDVFLAMRPVFDNGQFSGDYVSRSTRIECDPTLADPRFKNIDKSKSGRGATVRQN